MANENPPMNFNDVAAACEVTLNGESKYLVEALDDGLLKIAAAAHRRGVKAKLTVELTLTPKGNEVRLAARVKTSIPEPPPLEMKAYLDAHSRLVNDDPRQGTLVEIPRKGATKAE